jgi:hypothetical protein
MMMQTLRRPHTERFGINSLGAAGKEEPGSMKPVECNLI